MSLTDIFFDIDGTITPNFIGMVPGIERQDAQYIPLPNTEEEVPRHVDELMRWAHGRNDINPLWFSARGVESRTETMEQFFAESLTWKDTALIPTDNKRTTWWKVQVIEQWLAHPANHARRLVALDDDLSDCIDTGELNPKYARDPRLLIVSPDHCVGLTREHTDAVVRFALSGARPDTSLIHPQTDPNTSFPEPTHE